MSIGSHSFDHELKIGNVTKKLNIVRGDGGSPMYSIAENVPQYQDVLRFIMNDWKGGHGQFKHTAPDKYYDGQSIDTTIDGKVILAPLITTVGIDGGVLDAAPTKMVWFSAISKLMVATGSQVYWYATPYFVSKKTITNKTITDMVEFNGVLYVAIGASDKYYYSTDGATFTQTDLTDGYAVNLFVSPNAAGTANVLWKTKTPNEVSSTTDGRTVGAGGSQWASPTYCGDTSNNVTNIFRVNDLTMVGRTDNLYNIDPDGGVHALKDDLKHNRSTQNFKYVNEFQSSVYYSLVTGIEEITSYNTCKPANPLDTDDIGKVGTCCGITSDKDNLYVAMNEGTNIIIYKGREMKRGDYLRWEWCPFVFVGTNACTTIKVVQHSVSDRRLWFGYGTRMAYCILSDNPLADSAYKFCPSGFIRFSYLYGTNPLFDKMFQSIVTETAGCSATITATLKYRKDTDTSMITISPAINTNGMNKTYFIDPITCKRIHFEIDLATGSSSSTPQVSYFEAQGVEKPTVIRSHEVVYSIGTTPSRKTKTLRSFLRDGRTSTSMIRLADLRYGESTKDTEYVWVVMAAGYPQEVEIVHEKKRAPELGIKCKFDEIDYIISSQ